MTASKRKNIMRRQREALWSEEQETEQNNFTSNRSFTAETRVQRLVFEPVPNVKPAPFFNSQTVDLQREIPVKEQHHDYWFRITCRLSEMPETGYHARKVQLKLCDSRFLFFLFQPEFSGLPNPRKKKTNESFSI